MKKILFIIFLVFGLLIIPGSVSAISFDLIAPTEQLQRNQEVTFTINVDTEGRSLSSIDIGMTYDTQYLQYVSALAGNTFTTISAVDQGSGKLVLTGSSTTPYSGSGVFAYVKFMLIATSAGSTQLCALFSPEVTPTTPLVPTSTLGPSSPPGPTSPPAPTSLPVSGESRTTIQGLILALIFFTFASVYFFIFKRI
jgi:hypothetical protein